MKVMSGSIERAILEKVREGAGRTWWTRPCLLVCAGTLFALAPGTGSSPALAQGTQPEAAHGRDVHGVVVDADDGRPLPGAMVRLVELGMGELVHDDGSFHIERIPPGTYTVQADRLGYRVEEQRITVTEEGVEVLFELEPSALQLDAITVTATARGRAAGEALRPVNVVSESELLRRLQGTVAATIDQEPGVTTTSLGPATAKPVIRGLSGDRVLLLEDGERIGDLAASSADHASATDPLSAQRIEVVRGPAALLYGSNALGGVVNVIREEVPRRLPDRLTGRLSTEASSVNRGLAVGGISRMALGSSLALRLEGNGRLAGDLDTPAGQLQNSDAEVVNLSGGASWVTGGSGYAGTSYRFFRNEYGVPGGLVGGHEEGVRIRMRRHQVKGRSEWFGSFGPFSTVELSGAYTDYGHEELEEHEEGGAEPPGEELHTEFERRSATGELQARHDEWTIFSSGAVGIRFQSDDLGFGGDLNTEDATRKTVGAYLLQEIDLSPLTLEAGARYDWIRTTPDRQIAGSPIGDIRRRGFSAFSGSVGALVDVGGAVRLGASVSRAFRAPDVVELFSLGPHLAAYSTDVGNPDLEEEVGLGVDVFARLRGEEVRGEVAVFRNRIRGYVFPRSTGAVSDEGLPVYQYTGEDALFQGAEGAVEWALSPRVVMESTVSWVRGTLIETDEPIPFMPPLKGSAHLRFESPSWYVEGGVRAAAGQDRVGRFENPTEGYAVMDLGAGLRLEMGGRLHTLSLRLDNVTDREYRDHLSRLKEIMPQAGRGVSLLYRASL